MKASGRIKVISTSKIRKITAIRKNRKEKGNRAEPRGSNPHSNGDPFSRSVIVFFDSKDAIIITAAAIMTITVVKTTECYKEIIEDLDIPVTEIKEDSIKFLKGTYINDSSFSPN